jgi:hypothetical protein
LSIPNIYAQENQTNTGKVAKSGEEMAKVLDPLLTAIKGNITKGDFESALA